MKRRGERFQLRTERFLDETLSREAGLQRIARVPSLGSLTDGRRRFSLWAPRRRSTDSMATSAPSLL